ncbi:cytochrome P450 [Elsinoe ampelina]|uniref:Cytochrome P450 n=1 Tax=Elsinoe ampelina TaxID=302913 RepID=A0A6A6G159_9PEZI|nr:cytochrome P450 [Elsinoe ampelina]
MAFSLLDGLVLAALALLSLIVATVIQRLYIHPLAKIPGPKLAAVTGWCETYYDCVLSGQYTFKIEEMHRRYGPIVRINPREVHISDSSFYNTFYSMQNRLDKDQWFYDFNGDTLSGFATPDSERHRVRRKAIARYFSPATLVQVEKLVRRNVDSLSGRLASMHAAGKSVINLSDVFRSFSTDTVTQHCLVEGSNFLETDDFGHEYNTWVRTFSYMTTLNRHFTFLMPTFKKLPAWIVEKTSTPGSIQSHKFHSMIIGEVSRAMERRPKGTDTILEGLINADLPLEDRSLERIVDEMHTIVGAGSETTASTLDKIFFHVLNRPESLKALRDELSALPEGDRQDYGVLKRLPYLQGIVNEGLRITSGVCARLPRINRKAETVYGNYKLPPGTVISMGVRDVHHDPSIFPDPFRFEPARWINPSMPMGQYLVPFGKGARSCIGQDIALMEITMLTAGLLGRFDMKLYKTTMKEMQVKHEFFSPFPDKSFRGVQIEIINALK